jgi:hypothetical protein
VTIDAQVSPHSTGERNLAIEHLNFVNEDDLILYDRGYPAVWFWVLHLQKQVNFCTRAPVDSSIQIREFVASGRREKVVTYHCIEKSLRKCRDLGLPTTPIKLRLLRINLGKGKFEILVTSLRDTKKYPHKYFKDLYHQRWFIEEDYKLMKSRIELENFSGLSADSVKQDIHVKILAKNISAMSVIDAEPLVEEKCKGRSLNYQINFSQALSRLKDTLPRFILNVGNKTLYENLIIQVSKCVNAIRPNRKFDREDDQMRKRRRCHNMAYKRVV